MLKNSVLTNFNFENTPEILNCSHLFDFFKYNRSLKRFSFSINFKFSWFMVILFIFNFIRVSTSHAVLNIFGNFYSGS